jgi:NADPH:quinone reductase-like Zn-dependent oxidoreductase
MVGGDYVPRELDVLNTGGRLVLIAFQGGATAEISLQKIMQMRLVLTGSTLRPRSADEKARLTAEVKATVWPWIAAGKVKTMIDKTFPLADAGQAHAWVEGGAHVGKVVLTL